MTPPPENGIQARFEYMSQQIQHLREDKATNERVDSVRDDIEQLVKSVDGLRESFSSLMKAILLACVVWALGSAGFIIGVLTLASKDAGS
jgi:Mg2+ and Co2+ transporter CorA